MFCYDTYKAIKQQLNNIAPVFYYTGQYNSGKDNTSYRVPAIYVELPKASTLQFWGRKLISIKPAMVKIHYLSHAPFKAADGTIQDSAIQAHEATLKQIDLLLNGNALRSAPVAPATQGQLLTQQFISTGVNSLNFTQSAIFSIITYTTEIYSRHLRT